MPTSKYVSGTEILQHCWRMAKSFGIYENALFHTGADEFTWNENAKLWRTKTDRGDKIACRWVDFDCFRQGLKSNFVLRTGF